jgi:hypothetical protein
MITCLIMMDLASLRVVRITGYQEKGLVVQETGIQILIFKAPYGSILDRGLGHRTLAWEHGQPDLLLICYAWFVA